MFWPLVIQFDILMRRSHEIIQNIQKRFRDFWVISLLRQMNDIECIYKENIFKVIESYMHIYVDNT